MSTLGAAPGGGATREERGRRRAETPAGGADPTAENFTHTVELPDGSTFTGGVGWHHHLNNGARLYVLRDGQVRVMDWPKPMAAGNRAGDLGISRQLDGRPPFFGPGNRNAVTHGAHSPALVSPRVEELVLATVQHAPFLAQPSFSKALEAWARAEVRCALLEDFLDEHGLIDPQSGEPRPATKLMVQLEALALKHRTRLGLDAASRAGIEASLTTTAAAQASLEEVLERGAALLRERQAVHRAPETAPGAPSAPDPGTSQGAGNRGAQDATGAER